LPDGLRLRARLRRLHVCSARQRRFDGGAVRTDDPAEPAATADARLPGYKRPSIRALFTARDRGLTFLKAAGTIIFAISVVMWWLAYRASDAASA
jgi:hypothetical protein